MQDWTLAMNYPDLKERGDAAKVITYLLGAGRAYAVVNRRAQLADRPQLYCQPATVTLNGLDYLNIFEKQLAKPVPGNFLDYHDETALLEGLQEMFPCTTK
jgi:hypothetical protein